MRDSLGRSFVRRLAACFQRLHSCRLRFRLFRFERSKFRNSPQQGVDSGAHLGFVSPLPMKRLLQNVYRLKAQIHNSRRRLDFAVTQTANQILDAVRDATEPLQPHLRRRTLYGVNCAKQLVDFFGIVVAFQ